MVWGSFLIAAAELKTPTRNGYNAQGANLTFLFASFADMCWSPDADQMLFTCDKHLIVRPLQPSSKQTKWKVLY